MSNNFTQLNSCALLEGCKISTGFSSTSRQSKVDRLLRRRWQTNRRGRKYLAAKPHCQRVEDNAFHRPRIRAGWRNDLAAEVVRFLICWMHAEKLLQKPTPNAFASKQRKQRFDFAPQKPALRYLRFLLLILFSHRSLGVA